MQPRRQCERPCAPTVVGTRPVTGALRTVGDEPVTFEVSGALLRDAGAVLAARQVLDALLVELAAQPFNVAACRGLRRYLAGPAQRAQAAYDRLSSALPAQGS